MISHMIISKLKKPNSVLNRFRFNNIAGSEELIAQYIDNSVYRPLQTSVIWDFKVNLLIKNT